MKRILIILLILLTQTSVFAHFENRDLFRRNFELLKFNDDFSDEQKEVLINDNQEKQNIYWNQIMSYQHYREKTLNGRSEEDVYAEFMYQRALDFQNAFKITKVDFSRYSIDYANNNTFYCLFSDKKYWFIPSYLDIAGTISGIVATTENGSTDIYSTSELSTAIFLRSTFEYLGTDDFYSNTNFDTIKGDISDVKLIVIDRLPLLYIKTQFCEYGMCLGNSIKYTEKLENYRFYEINEIISNINSYSGELVFGNYSKSQKPDYTTEAESLADQGLLYGNENGLDLLKPMTRAEAATILMRALGGENQTPQVASFTDVPTTYWGFEPIEKASRLGIVKGVGDGLFDPEAKVTENQFATMLLRTANETDFDWQTAINLFVERGYITQEQADRMDLFTRGDMAKLIYEAKQHGMIAN